MNKKIIQVLLLLFAFIVVFLLGGLIVLKIKDEKPNNKNNETIKEESNYIEEYNLNNLYDSYKDIKFNSNTSLENITLYGLESLGINKILVENGKLKYYSNDKEYISNNLYDVKYIELATDNKNYTELLVYTSYGVYYYNTNGLSSVVDEIAKNEYFKEKQEKAVYYLENDVLNLSFVKLYNSGNIIGISTKESDNVSYFVVKTYTDTYTLNYIKQTKYGIDMVTQVYIGNKLFNNDTIIGYIGKDKKLTVNYDLSLKNNEILKADGNVLNANIAYLTKDAYYFVTNNNDIYILKLSDFDNNIISKYNTKDVESVSKEEEKTYQGSVVTSVKQYIKIIYKDGSNEEVLN